MKNGLKKTLRLEWKRDPDGYRIEERQEVRRVPKTLAEGDGVSPGGTFLVPRSGHFMVVEHNFDTGELIWAELLGAVAPYLDVDAVQRFAARWGLPNYHHEARVEEFRRAIPDILTVLNTWALETTGDDRGTSDLPERWRDHMLAVMRTLPRVDDHVRSGGVMHQVPKSLAGYCQRELMQTFEMYNVQLETCDWTGCRKLFVSLSNRGRAESKHRFCPFKIVDGGKLVQGKCRHDFHNKDQGRANGRTGARVAVPEFDA